MFDTARFLPKLRHYVLNVHVCPFNLAMASLRHFQDISFSRERNEYPLPQLLLLTLVLRCIRCLA